MLEAAALHQATKDKYDRMFRFVRDMRVKQKRHLFGVLRNVTDVSPDTFLPAFGIHCGEFACFQILSEYSRKESKRAAEQVMARVEDSSSPRELAAQNSPRGASAWEARTQQQCELA